MYRLLAIAVLLTMSLILGSCSSVDVGSESVETGSAQATGVKVRYIPDESLGDGWFVRGIGKDPRYIRLNIQPEAYTTENFVELGTIYDGYDWSYNPELRDMGLRVGSDGNLHYIGGDARSAYDPDEGPVVPWEELERRQGR